MTDHAAWLREWFSRRADLPADADGRNYFDEGWIDSLGVIELIEDIEAAHALRLGEAQFQDRRFASIGGLAEILAELSGGRP